MPFFDFMSYNCFFIIGSTLQKWVLIAYHVAAEFRFNLKDDLCIKWIQTNDL